VTYHQRISIYCTYTPSAGETKNFFGSINLQFSVIHEKTVSFNRYSAINPTFTVNGVAEFVTGQILNLFGSITETFTIDSLSLFTQPGIINLFGAINLGLGINGITDLPIEAIDVDFGFVIGIIALLLAVCALALAKSR